MCHNAHNVVSQSTKSHQYWQGISVYSAIKNVTRLLEKHCLGKNNMHTKVYSKTVNQNGCTLHDIEDHTQKESLILKHDVMLEREMQKGHTHWKNGRLSKKDLGIGVQIAERAKNLRKTIYNLYPQVEATTLRTFNRSVGHAIAVSGNFNIYENPGVLAGDNSHNKGK